MPDPLFIFGYGSLCWKADFAHDDSWIGHVRGWHRRFAQRSTDHRGTPEAPGLVVTLLTDEQLMERMAAESALPASSSCYGVCYRVSKKDAPMVLANLDFREKGGYTRAVIDVHPLNGPPVRALLYTANPSNPHFYLPPAEEAARIIATAVGPSGPNRDYLVGLSNWLATNQLNDAHVEELSQLVASYDQAAP